MCNQAVFHQTTTQMIEAPGGGWEFSCQECGYLARYLQETPQGTPRLEIINMGNVEVRHISSAPRKGVDGGNIYRSHSGQENELYWLTPESLRWLEDILQELD